METRLVFGKGEPSAYKAMLTFSSYLENSQISKPHQELIKIRASQLNGCAFCLDMHTKDARKYGESEQRLYVLSAWRETTFFTPEEQAILALTEEITMISKSGVKEETYKKAAELFDEVYISQVIMAIIVINSWNRIAITTHMQPAKG